MLILCVFSVQSIVRNFCWFNYYKVEHIVRKIKHTLKESLIETMVVAYDWKHNNWKLKSNVSLLKKLTIMIGQIHVTIKKVKNEILKWDF